MSKLQKIRNWGRKITSINCSREQFFLGGKKGKCEILPGVFAGMFVVALLILRVENVEDFC